jgi:hypothetical protein
MDRRDQYKAMTEKQRASAAKACGITVESFRMVMYGYKDASPRLAKRFNDALGIPLHELRPDVWDAA